MNFSVIRTKSIADLTMNNHTFDGEKTLEYVYTKTTRFMENYRDPSSILRGAIGLFCLWYAFNALNRSRKGKLPPGPRGLPFFGSLFELSADCWVKFTEWKYKYGEPGFSMNTRPDELRLGARGSGFYARGWTRFFDLELEQSGR
jgi:hypothetical protein